jgi:hypothetical protein
MALFMGQLLITGELLNKVAAPLFKRKYPFLRELSLKIVDDFVTAEIAGRYKLLGFKGYVAVHLIEFIFEPSVYRVDLQLSTELQPRFLRPLFMALLRKQLLRRPGVSWSGHCLSLDLAEMPFFLRIREMPAWGELFSMLEITRDKDSRGLLFNLFLHEPGLSDSRRG